MRCILLNNFLGLMIFCNRSSLTRMLLFSVIFFAACVRLTELAICPLSRHVVCNENYAERRCLCAMSLEEVSISVPVFSRRYRIC